VSRWKSSKGLEREREIMRSRWIPIAVSMFAILHLIIFLGIFLKNRECVIAIYAIILVDMFVILPAMFYLSRETKEKNIDQ
jgi:ABC-type transport system involved in cytochrome bd biosynthesis fused ATPase/permease subunit